MKVFVSLAAVLAPLSVLCSVSMAAAEEFIPIGDGYECVRYSNGNSYLINNHVGENYDFADSKAWANALAKERAKIADRSEKLKALAPKYLLKEPESSDVKTFKKYFKSYLFGLTSINIVEVRTQNERRAAVAALRQGLKDRKAVIKTFLSRINECEAGRLKLPKGVVYIYPRAQLVGFKATNNTESYGGYILIDKARKNKYSTQPTGFNGCLKIYWKNGEVGGLYTGMGDEPCFGRPGAFQYATQQCNATLQKGEVGFPLQKAVGVGVSDDTLQNVMDLAAQDRPQAIFMVMPVTMSRDDSIRLCDSFLNR
ncbi:MAG: hypothetical protein J0M12_13285 [Deltaproteobacteria bacterium]|nr:hypothetical protein [Deltaproteobacteria bacterium]